MKIFYLLVILVFVAQQANSQSGPSPATEKQGGAGTVKFYPNPATSFINFDFQKDYDKSYSFQIFNFLGRKVFDLSSVTPKTVVNLTDFYRGIYIFQLRDRNGKIVDSGKFQVSR